VYLGQFSCALSTVVSSRRLVVATVNLHDKLTKICAKRILADAACALDVPVAQLQTRLALFSALLPVVASCASEAQSAVVRLTAESVDLFDGFVPSVRLTVKLVVSMCCLPRTHFPAERHQE
jgi:hypothetical protein